MASADVIRVHATSALFSVSGFPFLGNRHCMSMYDEESVGNSGLRSVIVIQLGRRDRAICFSQKHPDALLPIFPAGQ